MTLPAARGILARVESICLSCKHFKAPCDCAAAGAGATGAAGLASGSLVTRCSHYLGERGRKPLNEVPDRSRPRNRLEE